MTQLKVVADAAQIEKVHQSIAPYIHRTPLLSSSTINRMVGAKLFFKCENFQKAGAFKSRGAVNAVLQIHSSNPGNGVCTHSSGNHAQALARAAALKKMPAFIVMPENAPPVKIAAVREYSGQITFCAPTLQAREETLAKVQAKTNASEVHPYNDPRVIMGQATCAKEVYEDLQGFADFIITPVGGGGLLSGTCLSTQCYSPDTRIIAAEPEGANDAFRSFHAGTLIPSENPNTIADGLLTSLGSNTWPIIQQYVYDICTSDDNYIIQAMRLIWERMKLIAEPSGVLPLAILLRHKAEGTFDQFQGKRMVLVISGGNMDLNKIPWLK